MSTKLERDVEHLFLNFCESLGVVCKKLKTEGESGWPDRTLFYKGRVLFLELKRRGCEPEPLQHFVLDALRKMGFESRWSNDFEQMKLIVLAWMNHVDDEHRLLEAVRKRPS